MAQDERDTRKITYDKEAQAALLKGAKEMADIVGISYGPKGLNVLVEKTYGRPMLTRDGVTISKEVYSKTRDLNMGMQLLNEAAEATVRKVGDGTTQTIVLAHQLIELAHQQIAAGVNPMEIKQAILDDSYKLLDRLKELTQPVKKGQLEQVAAVSSGDQALGTLIAEAVDKVGSDGGIITQRAPISDVDRTYVDGYYMQQGFTAIEAGKKEISNAYVIVTSKPVNTAPEVVKLVNKVVDAYRQEKNLPPNTQLTEPLSIAFVGEFEGLAYDTIVANIQKGIFDGVIVKSPLQGGDMASQYLEDIAIYTGGKLITKSDRLDDITPNIIGKAERISCTNSETTIFGGEGSAEDLEVRKATLKASIDKEEVDAISEKLKERLSKLDGKIAIFRIGGANDTEREEKEFRIDDAIQATKAAAADGVVAGAGTTLVELSRRMDITDLWKTALRNTYRKLLSNAALPAEVKLNEVLGSEYPQGFNLRKNADLVDVIAEGVLDPSKVVEQVLINAASTAANATTVGAIITFVDKKTE